MTAASLPALQQVHLRPGELLVTRQPQLVVTVLGSCVAVTMFEPITGLAAICHAMLAAPPPAAGAVLRSFRYMNHALPSMIDSFRRAGVAPERVEVKLFGGASVLRVGGGPCVGAANLAAARRLLRESRFGIRAENTGGGRGCKILFNTATGEVLHRHLTRNLS